MYEPTNRSTGSLTFLFSLFFSFHSITEMLLNQSFSVKYACISITNILGCLELIVFATFLIFAAPRASFK